MSIGQLRSLFQKLQVYKRVLKMVKVKEKIRFCLRCGRSFKSKGNFICDECHSNGRKVQEPIVYRVSDSFKGLFRD